MQGYRKILNFGLLMGVFFLCGCHKSPPLYKTSMQDIHSELQTAIANNKNLDKKSPHLSPAVSNALLPSMVSTKETNNEENEHRFNVVADKTPARTFFMGLVEGTRFNMVINPDVTGTISLNLKNVTIDETLRATRDVYGYDFRRTSYGYEVLAPEIQTQIFSVNYLDVERTGKSFTELTSGQISEKIGTVSSGSSSTNGTVTPPVNSNTEQLSGSQVKTQSKMDFWHGLKTTLETMIGNQDGRSVAVNAESGVVIVHAYPSELRRVGRYLEKIQNNLNRQVILEAKVLEVQLNNEYQAGIDWNVFGKGVAPHVDPVTGEVINQSGMSQGSFKTFQGTDLKDFSSIFTLNIKGDFGALIKLLQTQGNVQVLSSPRISTVNNQKAVIKVGQDEFFVTGVSTNNFVTTTATIPTQNVDLTPFFSGVTLDVTPQISKTGEIILHVHPTVSLVKEQQKEIQLGTVQSPTSTSPTPNTLSLPLALSTIRESDNIVRAHSGQIVVIGGLMQNNMREEVGGVPGLSQLPFIGAAFRRTRQISGKSELIILLRPVLANNRAWSKDMEKTDQGFREYNRGFHFGGLPATFGTEGEGEPE